MLGLSAIRDESGDIPIRTAGILFLMLGFINMFNEFSQFAHAIISTLDVASLLCLVIGTLLVLRMRSVLPFARFAVLAGLVLQGGYLIMHGFFLDFMLQLVLCSGLWILLSPRSTEFRILYLSGILLVSLVLCVDIIALTNRTNRGYSIFDHNNNISATAVDTVYGNQFAYRLDFGKQIWHTRNPDDYKKNNPAADLWLVDPQNDAHLLVIGERTKDGSNVNLDAFTQSVRYNLLNQNPGTKLLDVSRLYGVYYDGMILKLQSDIDGVPLTYLVGLYAVKNYAFQVIGYTHKNEFLSFKPNLVDAIKSFYFDLSAQQKRDHSEERHPLVDKVN